MVGHLEQGPAAVPARAKQAGEVRTRWAWTEPSVWTDRMLAALEDGVKGGKWYSLMDKVSSVPNLRAAFKKVKANHGAAGVDRQTTEKFEAHLEENLERLAASLRAGTHQPQPVRRVMIPKPGKPNQFRPLGIPTVRDRVVQTALRNVMEPIFERGFAEHSYGFRPGRGCRDALARVQNLLNEGYTHVVDADLQSYFDSIPHEPLLRRVEEKVTDGQVLALVRRYLTQEVMAETGRWTPEEGSPQGSVISPLLSNVYLDPLDWLMARQGLQMVRYADDFVVMARTRQEAEHALAEVQRWALAAGLKLHPDKTHIVDVANGEGFDFLGYHFERGYRWPRKKSLDKLKGSIRALTPRTLGHSLSKTIPAVNKVLQGWFAYFKNSIHNIFTSLDSWVRMRIRSILRFRHGGKGRGRGLDHLRWPNAYLAELGLFSLATAHDELRQPSRGKTTDRRAGCGKSARPVRREGGPG